MQRYLLFALLFVLSMNYSLPSHSKNRYYNKYKYRYGYAPPSWCRTEGYDCIRVKSGQSWQSIFPNDKERGIVMRINRSNRGLYPGCYVKVPVNLDYSDLLDHSPLPRLIPSQNEKVIVVDLNENAWGAYDPSGILVRWGPATGGRDWCQDIDRPCQTKPGSFRVFTVGSSDCVSTKFPFPEGGAPMPFCMFFNGGQALHGSPGGVMRGNVSHGCVRLFVSDAEWLRYNFVEGPTSGNHYRGTKVMVLPYENPAT